MRHAGSGHKEVCVGQSQSGAQRGELYREAAAAAVRVVEQGAGGAVVDDMVVGIASAGADVERITSEGAGGRQCGEDRVLQFDAVVVDAEVGQGVAVGGGIEHTVKANGIVSGTASQGVIK